VTHNFSPDKVDRSKLVVLDQKYEGRKPKADDICLCEVIHETKLEDPTSGVLFVIVLENNRLDKIRLGQIVGLNGCTLDEAREIESQIKTLLTVCAGDFELAIKLVNDLLYPCENKEASAVIQVRRELFLAMINLKWQVALNN